MFLKNQQTQNGTQVVEKTPNGMEFKWFRSTTGHIRCTLYSIIDTHKEEDVQYSVKWIKQNFKIIETVQVRWRKAEDETPMPKRIPSSVIIKNLNIEIGGLKAYVAELEDTVQTLQSLTPEEKKEIAKHKVHLEYEGKIKEQEALIKKLRKESEQLIIKLNSKHEHQSISGMPS